MSFEGRNWAKARCFFVQLEFRGKGADLFALRLLELAKLLNPKRQCPGWLDSEVTSKNGGKPLQVDDHSPDGR